MIMKASWPEFEDYFHNFIFMKVNVPLTLPLWRGEIFKETNAGISWNKLRLSKKWDIMNNLSNFPQNVLSKLSWHDSTVETGDE